MNDQYIQIEFNKTNFSNYLLDSEIYKFDSLVINELSGYIFSDNNDTITYTSIIWGNELFTITLDTPLDSQESIKIAQNIKISK